MHLIQKQLIDLIATNPNFGKLSLRSIAKEIGAEGKPQTAKYHLQELEKAGFIQMNLKEGIIKLVKKGTNISSKSPIFSIPVVGSANCGLPTIFAEQNIENFLKVSSSMLPKKKSGLFALIADGDSMNMCNINGKNIESGDFVLVDSEDKVYKDKDIVVAVVDGLATIKELHRDLKNNRIVLKAISTKKYLPIYLGEDDDFIINGKVVGIIKS